MSATLNSFLQSLYNTLDRRPRPETVAALIEGNLTLSVDERKVLVGATANAQRWSSMSSDFARPSTLAKQLATCNALFINQSAIDPGNVDQIDGYLNQIEPQICKQVAKNNFLADRLNKKLRLEAGLDISKRQYNKRFRLIKRVEEKKLRLINEQRKRLLALASKSKLAQKLKHEDFLDTNTAAFIAYYVARCNLRSVFTIDGQTRPFDEICEMLLNRCRNSETTHWKSIAYVMPDEDILSKLSADIRAELLAEYFALLTMAAQMLKNLWLANDFNSETMIVKRGNDSTTWNLTAGAWNKLRAGWFSFLYAMGLEHVVEAMCPGKVPRLMAADVAAWHRSTGGDLHKDTGPWRDLPFPWEVMEGTTCTKAMVEHVCQRWGIDAQETSWSAPPPTRKVVPFSPTPELVHGVEVASPQLAMLLRSLGVFSGKSF
jgi:hypothetical protein